MSQVTHQGRFTIVTPRDIRHWDSYVKTHRKASIFHTSAMVDVYRTTAGYEPFAVAALNDKDDIVALLVAVRVVTVSGIAGRFASRSILYAEPLCNDDEEGREGLVSLLEAHDNHMRSRTLYSEVRPLFAPASERQALEKSDYEYQDYLNYVVDLTEGADTIWQRLSKSTRQKIRRTRGRGVEIVLDSTHAGVEQMYELVQLSYQRSNVPLADASLFHAAVDHLPAGTVQIRLAIHNDVPIAGGIALVYKSLVYAWYGGSQRLSNLVPFDCLTWDEIEWGCRHGQRLYDFGGAGWPDEAYGPRDFKAKFGGQLVRYGRYRKIYSPWTYRVVEATYHTARRFISVSGRDASHAKNK